MAWQALEGKACNKEETEFPSRMSWEQPGRQRVRGTDTNQKEVEERLVSGKRTPKWNKAGIPQKVVASANSLW